MSKHTQGEWVAVGSWVELADPSRPDICVCNPLHFHQDQLPRSREEMRANARLIAAAPEMLAAIQCMLKDFGTGFDGMPSVGMCRAAIAKATGGKS